MQNIHNCMSPRSPRVVTGGCRGRAKLRKTVIGILAFARPSARSAQNRKPRGAARGGILTCVCSPPFGELCFFVVNRNILKNSYIICPRVRQDDIRQYTVQEFIKPWTPAGNRRTSAAHTAAIGGFRLIHFIACPTPICRKSVSLPNNYLHYGLPAL